MITGKFTGDEIERRRQESVELHAIILEDKCINKFYADNGPCCAGCDNWRYYNPVLGECVKSNVMAHADRISLLGYKLYTGPRLEAGHVLTRRDYHCENFFDSDI